MSDPVPSAVPTEELVEIGQGVWQWANDLVELMLRPWNAYQLLIAAGLFLVAHLGRTYLSPPIYAWMRAREGWPMARMRWLVFLHKRLRLIIFVAISLITVQIMREVTWNSRSYILGIIANLALAWLVVTLATRLINNNLLRLVVRYGAIAWIGLRILNLTDQAQVFLDALAIEIGDLRISAWLVLQAAFIIGVLFVGARYLSRTSSARLRANKDLSPSMQVLTIKMVQLLLYGAALFIGLKAVGVDLTGLAVLSGAIGVGLGFGLQKVVSNLVSGVIILLDKSIKPGDVISLGDTFGWIEALGARYVSVVTRDGKEYLIPNEDLITGQVVNWSHSNDYVRLDLTFGTAYSDDPHKVRKIAVEAASSVRRVITSKPPVCHITGFGDSSVDYMLRFWITDPTGGLANIKGDVYLAIWDAFQEHGISIPFPQREVLLLPGSELTRKEPAKKG